MTDFKNVTRFCYHDDAHMHTACKPLRDTDETVWCVVHGPQHPCTWSHMDSGGDRECILCCQKNIVENLQTQNRFPHHTERNAHTPCTVGFAFVKCQTHGKQVCCNSCKEGKNVCIKCCSHSSNQSPTSLPPPRPITHILSFLRL